MVQAAEEEVTQLQKGNAGLIDSVAELKVQVNAAAFYSLPHCNQPLLHVVCLIITMSHDVGRVCLTTAVDDS